DYSIKAAIELIRSDKYKDDIERLRNSDNKSIQTVIKNNLDYFAFSGTFRKRLADHLIKHSGILCLDFDKLSIEILQDLISKFKEVNFILAFFVSPSGNGIKVLIKINGK